MNKIAVRVGNLGKLYHIGVQQRSQYQTLRDTMANAMQRPARMLKNLVSPSHEDDNERNFWALKDVSFEIKLGEIVGIIGRNGAGKSTLLKILARITEPTTGFAEMRGRIGSLLEVGTGFHPELTGRENIFLNGTILGMKRAEIKAKFDEIVAFAEVERFLDTPVKHYSSGMHVRLAFAVAAHLEPDILIIDEVLAVGDSAFQQKCLGKMDSVVKEGRTVLFVSHNLSQMKSFCRKGLWLQGGRAMQYGLIDEVVASYQKSIAQAVDETMNPDGASSSYTGFLTWEIADTDVGDTANKSHMLLQEAPFSAEFMFRLDKPISQPKYLLSLLAPDGKRVGGWEMFEAPLPAGTHKLCCEFPYMPVRPGVYTWSISLWDAGKRIDRATLHPEFVVATKDHSQLRESVAGILNVPCNTRVETVNMSDHYNARVGAIS